ncbi:hypothetical protein BCR33DRAFT_720869 [Rhizoclosmatium globosum]|uniref:Pre-mRNA-splicing factor CWC26 n=1 Tax=Rhizoclosmatium globosum TaxID=329046 RepID=A0A1Y2BU49_9FUNG|nr:hypothetical protein BCR33DRAFT_720869 [Rhizoclosmatium globosum]|eukprot:ORY38157.1 hypothetical protein BCR33DRAFT_720869 [Rhizoclosmatium globosum]
MSSKAELLLRYTSMPPPTTSSAPTTKRRKKSHASKPSHQKGSVVLVDDDDFPAFATETAQLADLDDVQIAAAPASKGFSAAAWDDVRPARTQTVKDVQSQMEAEGYLVHIEDNVHADDVVHRAASRRSPSPSPPPVSRRRTPSRSPSPSPPPAASASSKGPTVYRDKLGRLVNKDKELELDALKQERLREEEAERLKFKGGLAQEKERDRMQERLRKERNSKFAVSINDEELNERLKGKQHWGDPLANTSNRSTTLHGTLCTKQIRIEPGYRWDGLDRGNGFELKLTQSKYAKVSTEDM